MCSGLNALRSQGNLMVYFYHFYLKSESNKSTKCAIFFFFRIYSGLVHWEDPEGSGGDVGEGIGMGNTCKSMADSCQCMAKNTTIN